MENMLTVKEVAKKLNCGIQTVYNIIKSKELDAVNISAACLRVRREDLDNFIKKNKTKTNSE